MKNINEELRRIKNLMGINEHQQHNNFNRMYDDSIGIDTHRVMYQEQEVEEEEPEEKDPTEPVTTISGVPFSTQIDNNIEINKQKELYKQQQLSQKKMEAEEIKKQEDEIEKLEKEKKEEEQSAEEEIKKQDLEARLQKQRT
tara:strand:+ start:539 stop:964 length:426 start_codon:yes stop_codon:yes gene_type:complete